jgi:hypothetical protein
MLEVAHQIVTIINGSNPVAVISLIAFGAIGVAALALVVVHTAIRQGKSK